ncbi:helix-turn-helix transcriptional regulator [Streptomyces gardneri]|uniref:helix-turn-helix domain-containing protein n=1 Tax=Nocardia TaxID=1817 RepID=UPI00135999FF|nr:MULTISPECIES: helix-turn-helix transcriptional regulator [Nocardia]MBF6165804.1 helix-turn-helix transcriptional regulator [Streptomyces gardneri]MBF6203127.1 helix-turn-helix transcriptional regulator [Streptomyces gardneri]UAK29986.1 helix-turn-helix transcriptional regulator [Nocardia asteroides]
MTLLREAIGDSLRRARLAQNRTLREVSTSARVSLGYLSEVERGRKEASSELLAAICEALDVPLSRVLWDVSTIMAGADGPAAAAPVDEAAPAPAAAESEQTAAEPAAQAEPALAPTSASMSAADPATRPLPLAEDTRIVIPAPRSDMLVLVKGV